MARLTIQNVAAPDFGSTSTILNNAGRSLNAGIESASGIIDKYNQGQQEAADAAILSTIAGINSEEELGSFLNSGKLEGLNVSPKMQETILNLRKNVLANDQSRANIGQTKAQTGSISASTAIKRAAEGRAAAEYADSVAARTERRGLVDEYIGAVLEGNAGGRGIVPGQPATTVEGDSSIPVKLPATPDTVSTPKFDLLGDAVKKSLKLDLPDALKVITDAYQAQAFGQKRIDEDRAKVRSEQSATAILDAVKDPTNVRPIDISRAVINNPALGFNSNDIISAAERADALLQGPLGQIASPNVPESELIRNASDVFDKREQLALDASVQTRLAQRIDRYGSNPTKGLVEELRLGTDGESPDSYLFGLIGEDYDELDVTRKINRLAEETKTSPAAVAAAMAEVFQRDPGGFNTLDNRIDDDQVKAIVKNNLSQDALSRYEENKILSTSRRREVSALNLRLSEAKSRAAKYPTGQVPANVTKTIQDLENQILQVTNQPVFSATEDSSTRRAELLSYTARKGYDQKLANTPKSSPARRKVINELVNEITTDPNLSSSQRARLILSISGE